MRDIPGYPGYMATADGAIVSVRSGERLELKARLHRGYCVVTMKSGTGKGDRIRRDVHRLVCLAWHGVPIAPRLHVRHLDGVSTNNTSGNLAWGTPAENAADAIRHGTLGKGERARRLKLSDQQVNEIVGAVRAGRRTEEIAAAYGVSRYYPNKLAAHGRARA